MRMFCYGARMRTGATNPVATPETAMDGGAVAMGLPRLSDPG
jgi:hypothetical protein